MRGNIVFFFFFPQFCTQFECDSGDPLNFGGDSFKLLEQLSRARNLVIYLLVCL